MPTPLLFTETTCLQDSHGGSKVNVFDGATVFLYFDSCISKSQQICIRKQLHFQGATISEFYNKKVNIVLSNKSAKKKFGDGSLLGTSASQGAIMLRKSLGVKKKIGDGKTFIQKAEIDGIKVIFIEDVTLGLRPLRAPFLKVEEHGLKFKPLILEMSEWPDLEKMFVDDKEVKPDFAHKKGLVKYCGLCEQHYESMSIHVASATHKQNAKDDTKWREVDKLIKRQQTPTEFVETMITKSKKQ